MDAKDILGLPKNSFPSSQEKKPRPQKDSQRKPDGVHREVYALTGGMAPLMPTIEVSHLKKKQTPEKEEKTDFADHMAMASVYIVSPHRQLAIISLGESCEWCSTNW